MPWCPTCNEYRAPSAVRTDGTCPSCGTVVDPGAASPAQSSEPATRVRRLPWHVKLLAAAFTVYLAYRIAQGVAWVVEQL